MEKLAELAGVNLKRSIFVCSLLYATTRCLILFFIEEYSGRRAVKNDDFLSSCISITHLSTSSRESGKSSSFLTTVIMNKDQKIGWEKRVKSNIE